MSLDSTKHPVSQRECLPVPLPAPAPPARRGRGWTRHRPPLSAGPGPGAPEPQEGPTQWEVVLGDEGHLPDWPAFRVPLLWSELSWPKPRWLATLCEAADGDPCLSGRKEMVKIAWLIPVCSPWRASLQRQRPSGFQELVHRTAGQPVYRRVQCIPGLPWWLSW